MQTNHHDLPFNTALPGWVHWFVLLLTALALVLISSNAVVLPAHARQKLAKPGIKPVASVQQVMKLITIPASDVIFGAAGDAPKTDSAWLNILYNAMLVAESGNLLMMPGRARDNEDWMKQSQALLDAAMIAFTAAEAKNADRLADAGDTIYSTCQSCHDKYMTK